MFNQIILLLIIGISSHFVEIDGNELYDVVIIGAGPAGIAAAMELKRARPTISMAILEARNRIGGRVFTDKHTFKDEVVADIGAEWIHAYGRTNPLYKLHRQLQTPEDQRGDQIFEFFTPSITGCYDIRGSIVPRQICRQAQHTFKKLFSPKYNRTLDEKDISVRDMIRPEYEKIPNGLLKQLVDAMLVDREEHEAADLESISARQTFFDDSAGDDEEDKGDDMALVRGYGTLIKRIAKKSNLTIELNSIVTKVSVEDSDSVEISTRAGRTIESKFVLITVPLGCLKKGSIEFMPALPPWKIDAINAMGFGDTDKIILQFEHVFWDRTLTTFYIAGSSFPFAICAPKKKILVFMVGGSRARRMEATNDQTTIETILTDLKAAFPRKTIKLVRSRISRWTQDIFAYGSYSYYALNTNIKTFEALAKQCCNDRLFWAGEHTSTGGSVHTAFATGQREAKNLLRFLV